MLAAARAVCVYVCVFIATIKPSKWKCNANTSSPVVERKFPARRVAYIWSAERTRAREAKPITKAIQLKHDLKMDFNAHPV